MGNLILKIAIIVLMLSAMSVAAATILDDELYYLNLSNALVDLNIGGDVYYGEIYLEVIADNTLNITVNPYDTTEVVDSLGNTISSPLTALDNFGVQVFAMNTGLTNDESEFVTRYDIQLPEDWSYQYDKNISEFGVFEFRFDGTGSSRQDSLEINISPKDGADLTGYEFGTVAEFIELNEADYYFAAHIASFSVPDEYIEEGSGLNSAWFSTGSDPPPLIPEPTTSIMLAVGALKLLRRKKK